MGWFEGSRMLALLSGAVVGVAGRLAVVGHWNKLGHWNLLGGAGFIYSGWLTTEGVA